MIYNNLKVIAMEMKPPIEQNKTKPEASAASSPAHFDLADGQPGL